MTLYSKQIGTNWILATMLVVVSAQVVADESPTSRIAVMETAFSKWADVSSIAAAKNAGYTAIQMHTGMPPGFKKKPIDQKLSLPIGDDSTIVASWKTASNANGVQIISLCAGALNKCEIWKRDREVAMRIAKQSIDACHTLKTKTLLFPFFGPSKFQTSDEAINGIAAFMKELLPYAELKDVVIGIEAPVTTVRVLELLEMLKFPKHLKIYYDTGNLFDKEDIYQTIRKHAKQHFCEIHIKAADNAIVGEGKIELDQLAKALDDSGYDRWLVYEANRSGKEPVANRKSIEKIVSLRTNSSEPKSAPELAAWPNWMGQNHDGISTESGWSVDWPVEGLQEAWTKELGTGFSSFSVVDGLAYSMGHRDGKETVWCLDAETGDTVWSYSYSAKLNPNLYEGGPGSTPTVHADMVFTLSVDGRLIGFKRKTGEVVWEVDLQKELEVGMHEWGFNASPYILDNQLLLECGRVVSFDRKTGKKLWQSKKHEAGYGSVRSFKHGDQTLLASVDCDGLRISRATDGSEVAFTEWRSPYRTNSTTPIIFEDRIFVSTGYNVGSALFQLTPGGLKKIYSQRKLRNHFNNSILYEGHLYGFDGNSNLGRVVRLTCIEFETGKVKWQQRGMGCGSLMIANKHLLILSDQGDLVLAKATPQEFREVSRSRFLQGRCWTAPVLIDNRIYGRNAAGKAVCAQLPKQ